MGDREGMTAPLEGLAAVTAAAGRAEEAARLDGAAAHLRVTIGAPRPPFGAGFHDPLERDVAAVLGPAARAAAYAAGAALTPEAVADLSRDPD